MSTWVSMPFCYIYHSIKDAFANGAGELWFYYKYIYNSLVIYLLNPTVTLLDMG